jgi:hypothetical protein
VSNKKRRKEQRRLEELRRQQAQSGGSAPPASQPPAAASNPESPEPLAAQDSPPTVLPSGSEAILAEVDEVRDQLALSVPQNIETPPNPGPTTVNVVWRQLETARRYFIEARERVAQQARELETKLRKANEVVSRERVVAEREATIEAGLLAKNEETLAELRDQHDRLLSDIREAQERALVAREEALASDLERQAAWDLRLADLQRGVESRLEESRREMAARSAEMAEARIQLEVGRQTLAEKESLLTRTLEARIAERVAVIQAERDAATRAVDAMRIEHQRLADDLRVRDDLLRAAAGRSATELLSENKLLSDAKKHLELELANRPGPEVQEALSKLQELAGGWDRERSDLQDELRKLGTEAARLREAHWDADIKRKEVNSLEKQREVLELRLAELEKRIESYLTASSGGTPFKACAAMDANPHLLQAPKTYKPKDSDDVMAKLVQFLQHSMAKAERPLYFREQDVRSFVAGMAMSRLILLQGISGIGKTSLPQAVVSALKGGSRIIPVQAGWRDRHDLLGHFNTFEGRYRESEFLLALYEAQTEAFRQRAYFIILDEVNLSRPEQYFADVLSAMELDESKRELVLTDIPAANAPRLLIEGRKICIPNNVWFVGTANHDETTVEFAAKTIDRAHVLELPAEVREFTPSTVKDLSALDVHWLLERFRTEEDRRKEDIAIANEVLFDTLKEPLAQHFGIGLSGRLRKQLRQYTAVNAAAGGSASEALDDILAMRILSRIRDRHDLQAGSFEDFKEELLEAWVYFDKGAKAERSIRLLDREIARLKAYSRGLESV